jgi:hypothetical protein
MKANGLSTEFPLLLLVVSDPDLELGAEPRDGDDVLVLPHLHGEGRTTVFSD